MCMCRCTYIYSIHAYWAWLLPGLAKAKLSSLNYAYFHVHSTKHRAYLRQIVVHVKSMALWPWPWCLQSHRPHLWLPLWPEHHVCLIFGTNLCLIKALPEYKMSVFYGCPVPAGDNSCCVLASRLLAKWSFQSLNCAQRPTVTSSVALISTPPSNSFGQGYLARISRQGLSCAPRALCAPWATVAELFNFNEISVTGDVALRGTARGAVGHASPTNWGSCKCFYADLALDNFNYKNMHISRFNASEQCLPS